MNIDWPRVRATGEVIAGLTAIHGLRYRKWEYVHTFGVVMGFAATAAILLYGDVSTLRGETHWPVNECRVVHNYYGGAGALETNQKAATCAAA
jgi:hypothetical protein